MCWYDVLRWCVEMLTCWCIDELISWYGDICVDVMCWDDVLSVLMCCGDVEILIRWCADVSMYWCVLMRWCVDVLMWCVIMMCCWCAYCCVDTLSYVRTQIRDNLNFLGKNATTGELCLVFNWFWLLNSQDPFHGRKKINIRAKSDASILFRPGI